MNNYQFPIIPVTFPCSYWWVLISSQQTRVSVPSAKGILSYCCFSSWYKIRVGWGAGKRETLPEWLSITENRNVLSPRRMLCRRFPPIPLLAALYGAATLHCKLIPRRAAAVVRTKPLAGERNVHQGTLLFHPYYSSFQQGAKTSQGKIPRMPPLCSVSAQKDIFHGRSPR